MRAEEERLPSVRGDSSVPDLEAARLVGEPRFPRREVRRPDPLLVREEGRGPVIGQAATMHPGGVRRDPEQPRSCDVREVKPELAVLGAGEEDLSPVRGYGRELVVSRRP